MDRVIYAPTANDMLVWKTNESDIIIWDVEPEVPLSYSRVENTVYIAGRFECCGPF